MRVVSTFAATGALYGALGAVDLPMAIELADLGRFEVFEEPQVEGMIGTFPDGTRHLRIVGERSIEPAGLFKVDHLFSGSEALDTTASDIGRLAEGAHHIAGSIAFATGVAIQVSTAFGDEYRNELLPDTEADAEELRRLGTRAARIPLAPTRVVETFARVEVDRPLIAALASRQIASVYADALGDLSPAARFFSLWRTLEFAFQAEGKDLVLLLLDFPRVSDTMEFDRFELEELRAIRGRLGHAVSRGGYREILTANALAIRQVGRLWCLVDWVVDAKPGPGRDDRCEPLAELTAYIDRAGKVKMVDPGADAADWVESWSHHSPRFRS